jgi:hypothetical protein
MGGQKLRSAADDIGHARHTGCNQGAIGQRADPDREIDLVVDQILMSIGKNQSDVDLRMAGKEIAHDRQHRGGPRGFLRALDERTLACADFRGNRQYISVGNLAMDYPHRRRLKMFVHVEVRVAAEDPKVQAAVTLPGYRAKVERALVFHLEAFDWNCPQHITPRFTEAELTDALGSVRERMKNLEAENAQLKERLARANTAPEIR